MAASGASSTKRTDLPSGSMPSCFQSPAKSTGIGSSFILLYRSVKTVTPVALSPTLKASSTFQSSRMSPPAARIARSASCKPFWLWVRSRI